jgi:hypothetical protein
MTGENSHKTDWRASSKPFPMQRVQEGEIAFVEMTKSCARDLTDRIKAGVNDVAELLHRAHEGRAWVALGYVSWKEYCRAEFQMSKPRSYQLLEFVEIKREIERSTFVDPPQNEGQARALGSVPAEKRVEVWERANEIAGSDPLTAKHVEQAVVKLPQRLKKSSLRFPANFAMRFGAPSRRR